MTEEHAETYAILASAAAFPTAEEVAQGLAELFATPAMQDFAEWWDILMAAREADKARDK